MVCKSRKKLQKKYRDSIKNDSEKLFEEIVIYNRIRYRFLDFNKECIFMGAWGYKFYENDEAADWLHQFWDTKSFDLLVKEVEQFDPRNENYDTIRVIAHILICFGSPYTCPEDFLDQRSIIIKRVLTILENMINPPNSDWDFLDIWDNDPTIISEVEKQIIELKKIV